MKPASFQQKAITDFIFSGVDVSGAIPVLKTAFLSINEPQE